MSMGQYTKKGLYNSYDKNHKEREADDYYATPTVEVVNILNTLNFDFENKSILEPCIGGGHMALGISQYLEEKNQSPTVLLGTDFKDRGFSHSDWFLSYGWDFIADDYPIEAADVVIMNPPFAIIEPFLIRALEIAKDKLIVLGRMQILEGSGRYKNIFQENPPTDIYQYIDRVQCWKGGVKPSGTSAQAYCWLVWDKSKKVEAPQFHWIHRSDKY
jgi:hypothetical protein